MNAWYNGESTIRPVLIDDSSSKVWVYVRRNVEEHERENEQGIKETFYSYEEQKVPKEVWEIFEKTVENDERIADVEEAITELYGVF